MITTTIITATITHHGHDHHDHDHRSSWRRASSHGDHGARRPAAVHGPRLRAHGHDHDHADATWSRRSRLTPRELAAAALALAGLSGRLLRLFAWARMGRWKPATSSMRRACSAWLDDLIEFGAPRADAHAVRRAFRAVARDDWAALAAINELAVALAGSRERRLETSAQGRAFVVADARRLGLRRARPFARRRRRSRRLSRCGRRRGGGPRLRACSSRCRPSSSPSSPISSRRRCGSARSARPTASAFSPRCCRV